MWLVWSPVAEAQNSSMQPISREGFVKNGGEWVINSITLELSYSEKMAVQDQVLLRSIAREINRELGTTAIVTYGHKHEGCIIGNAISEICLDETGPEICCDRNGNPLAGRAQMDVLGWGFFNLRRPYVFDKIDREYGFYPSTHLSYKTGDIAECDVHIHKDQRQWHYFRYTIKHELLHCLGFAHYKDGIMYPSFTNVTVLPDHIIDKWWEILEKKHGGFMGFNPLYITVAPAYETVVLRIIEE